MLSPTIARKARAGVLRQAVPMALAVAGALALAGPASAETVRGVFRYEDINPATGARHMQPIAQAKVEIWRGVPGLLGICFWGNAWTVETT